MFLPRHLCTRGFLSSIVFFGIKALGQALASNATTSRSTPAVASINLGAPLRVLPLGDSITWGYNEASGNSYRRDVECLMYTGGNMVTLIGSIKHGDWSNNDGDDFIYHTIDQIQEAALPELTRNASRPNVILLHAGTVNFVLGINVTNAPARLGFLIDFITDNNPISLLVVSQLIPNANTSVNALIDQYNDALPAVVASRARLGKRVILTSMYGVTIETHLLPDGTHLNEKGSRLMAKRFYEAVVGAGLRGLVVPADGPFIDSGASSLPPSGKCSDLTD